MVSKGKERKSKKPRIKALYEVKEDRDLKGQVNVYMGCQKQKGQPRRGRLQGDGTGPPLLGSEVLFILSLALLNLRAS